MIGRMYDNFEFAPREGGEPEQFTYDFGRDTDALTAELDAFGAAAMGQEAYPVSRDEIIHVVAVLEAIIKSAESGSEEKVG
jgi:predicted dehydrogenase